MALHENWHYYGPQTKLRGGNVFTPVCQSFCSQGVSTYGSGMSASGSRGSVHPLDTPLGRHLPRPRGRHPPGRRWPLKWVVRILLECILVLIAIWRLMWSFYPSVLPVKRRQYCKNYAPFCETSTAYLIFYFFVLNSEWIMSVYVLQPNGRVTVRPSGLFFLYWEMYIFVVAVVGTIWGEWASSYVTCKSSQ